MADIESSFEFSSSLTSSSLPPPRTRIFKIIVIGDSGVGKTCLTYRFCADKFPDKTEATIGVDFREKVVEIDGEQIKVSLYVCGGNQRLVSLPYDLSSCHNRHNKELHFYTTVACIPSIVLCIMHMCHLMYFVHA